MYKGKSVPLQAWSGPEVSRKLRFVDYMSTAQDGGKVVSVTHRPPLPPGNIYIYIYLFIYIGKSVPLQAWSGPEVSRKLRFVDYMTMAQDSGKVVCLTHRPPLTPGNIYIYICIKVNQSHYRPGVALKFPDS